MEATGQKISTHHQRDQTEHLQKKITEKVLSYFFSFRNIIDVYSFWLFISQDCK